MPTSLSARAPLSITETYYNDGLWNDTTPWGGYYINNTQWNITRIGGAYWIDVDGDYMIDVDGNRFIVMSEGGSLPIAIWTGRPLI